ncbi:MAG: hypothetical protein JST90_16360 [Bacteroidetes bacterium]|nr:hypothetical protein [Bacteroidota bacterium]
MRKLTYALALLSIVFITSCKKNNSSNPGGSWTFKSVSHTVVTCSYQDGYGVNLTAIDQATAGAPYDLLRFTFFTTGLPTADGYYTVGSIFSNDPSEVAVEIYDNGTGVGGWSSTGRSANGDKERVTVKVSGACYP